MLTVSSLNQFYGESHTLRDISLTAPAGECTVVMGRNGVGKTTLLECIVGLLSTRDGTIELDGNNIVSVSAENRARRGLGYVPQGRQIFPVLTVEENLRIGLAARTDGVRKVPDEIYELFPVLDEMRSRRGGDLSGGQQQQLAIGRAMVTDPSVLILDEPTEGIQPNIVADIGAVVQRLTEENGMTVLLVEQKLPFARAVGKHFCIVDRGQSVASGEMSELNDQLVRQHLTV